MSITVDIDSNSGFCAGVTRAIGTAEKHLATHGGRLYSLGAIVHNDAELERLEKKGLVTIDRDDLSEMVDAKGESLLIRAHGEPPSTYKIAGDLGFEIVDCTCPVVLKLQASIREAYMRFRQEESGGQIIIFGKIGHAEVLGLKDGEISLRRKIEIFSQTTKNPAEYAQICSRLEELMARENELSVERFKGRGLLKIHNTICSQVATRHSKLSKFAIEHDIIIFVSGKASSNGQVLCDRCKSLNIRTYHIETKDELRREWFRPDDKVGVCGAASTPKWLLEAVADDILTYNAEA